MRVGSAGWTGQRATMFLSLGVLFACGSGSGDGAPRRQAIASIPLDTIPTTHLPIELLGSDTLFGQPEHAEMSGESLIITDEKGIPFIHEIGLDGRFTVSRSWGARGEGPGQFQSIMNLTVSEDTPTRIWAFDVVLQRLTDVMAAGLDGRMDSDAVVSLSSEQRVLRALWLNDSTILGIGRHDSNRVVLFNQAGSVRQIASGSLIGKPDLPENVRATVSSGVSVCSQRDGEGVAILHSMEGRIDLFDGVSVKKDFFEVPVHGTVAFYEPSPGDWQPRFDRTYYLSCVTHGPFLYALFSGRGSADYSGLDLFGGEILHVFNWKGHLVGAYQLTAPLSRLGASTQGRLFGTRFGSVEVWAGNLPSPEE